MSRAATGRVEIAGPGREEVRRVETGRAGDVRIAAPTEAGTGAAMIAAAKADGPAAGGPSSP